MGISVSAQNKKSSKIYNPAKNFTSKKTLNRNTKTFISSENKNIKAFASSPKASATIIWSDGFETDKGWTMNGEWERGKPEGLGASWFGSANPDPSSAFEGSNVIGVDLSSNGRYQNNISASNKQIATSPVIDCSIYKNIHLTFERWLGVERNNYDHARIDVFDGTTWQNVWQNGTSTINEDAWTYIDIDVSAYADGNPKFQVRFSIGSTDRSVNYCGWNIDDLKITGDLNGSNSLVAGATAEPATIASTVNTESDASINFDFKITDDGSTPAFDTKNTLINSIIINQGTGNDIADWTQAIEGAEITDGTTTYFGTINTDNITFSSLPNAASGDIGYIADNAAKTYSIKIWLRNPLGGTLAQNIDGKNFVFEVNSSSFGLETASSGFASSQTVNSGSTNNEVTVTATELQFSQQPSNTATSNTALSQQPIVAATDANGNIDLDYSGTITLSNSGSLSMTNNTATMSAGIANFSDLTFTSGGKYVTLSASDNSINSILPSVEIAVDIIGCELFSENFDSYADSSDLPTAGNEWKYIERTSSVNDWGIATVSGSDKCLTIYNDKTAFSYDANDDGEEIAYYTKKIDASDYRNLKLYMKWQSNGEQDANGYWDYGVIVWSTDGVNWSIANQTAFQGQSTWTTGKYDLSVCDGQQFYIGFRWKNDGNTGNNPPFAVDNVIIRGLPDFDYRFSYRNDNYVDITGTIASVDANDGVDISLPSGFNFNYDGNAVSVVRANINGWLEMGNSLTDNAETNNLSDVTKTPLVAPLWDDLVADASTKIIYRVDGTAPTRIFTIEWKSVLWDGQRENFQVKLYETSSIIEFWYGTMNNPSTASASIGINAPGCGTFNKMISITPYSTPVESYTAENSSIDATTYLTEGLVYIFNPLYMQEYKSWQNATNVVGQKDFSTTSTTASQTVAAGANSSAVSSKGILAVGSAYANRVLLWDTLPETNGAAADVVIGQTNFSNTSSGTTASTLKTPMNVTFSPDGTKLIVADAGNNRVLIWDSIPKTNGVAADHVIGQKDFTSNGYATTAYNLHAPSGVLVLPDGRLLITDNGNNRVLIYNQIPTENGDTADIVIGQADFTSNGAGSGANELNQPWDCAYTPEGKLLISDDGDPSNSTGNHRILVFNNVPTSNDASADVVIGNTVFDSKAPGTTKDEFNQPSITCSVEGKLAVADFGNSRIMLYNRVPAYNGADADFVLGQPNFETSPYYNDGYDKNGSADQRNMYYPYSICFDLNGRLYVNGTQGDGTGMNRVMVYGNTPSKTADLAVTIHSDATSYCVYNNIEYTVNLINKGPDDAYNVTVNAQLPAGMNAQNYTAENGSTYNQKSGYWYIPYIANGDTAKLSFSGQINPDLAASNVTAYAYTIASSQKDNDYSNNSDNSVVAVRSYYAPTISLIDNQYIRKNSHTNPVISFTVDDKDGLSDIDSYTASSSDTNLIPVDYNNNIIFGGTAPNKTLDIYPLANQFGYSDMSVIVTDKHGCYSKEDFSAVVGNFWEGDNSSNPTEWKDSLNWSFGIPSDTLEAIIPSKPKGDDFPVIDSAGAKCQDLVIEPNASVTVNDGFGLHIYGKTYIKSDIYGTGALVDFNSSSTTAIVNDDSIFVDRYLGANAWHYISSPLDKASNKILTENNCNGYYNGNVLIYNEAYNSDYNRDDTINWQDGWEWPWYYNHNNNPLLPTVGYGYYSFDQCDRTAHFNVDSNVNFNTGSYTITVTNQDDSDNPTGSMPHRGWNLIGNPYPSGLNADNFLNTNSSVIDETINFWDESGESGFNSEGQDYATYNPTLGGTTGSGSGSVIPDKYISIGQGFFVHKTSSSPVSETISMNNSMRNMENSSFFKKAALRVEKVKISMTNGKKYNELIVGLLPDATKGIDPKYDGYKVEGMKDFSFYSLIDSNRFVNQAIPTVKKNANEAVALGFNAQVPGEYIIERKYISNIPANVNVLLEDRYTDSITNLKTTSSYSFVVEQGGRFNDRFVLHFNYNNPPYLAHKVKNMTALEDEQFSKQIPKNTFKDADKNEQLIYNLTMADGSPLPSWMKFNSDNLMFYAAPTNDNVGNYELKLTATDFSKNIISTKFYFDVENVNDPPVVNKKINDIQIYAGTDFSYTIPKDAFIDVDKNDHLTYMAIISNNNNSSLWLDYNAETKTFKGHPYLNNVGTYYITVNASDNDHKTASQTFKLTVLSPKKLEKSDIVLYPNPSDGVFNIFSEKANYKLQIIDQSGKTVYTTNSDTDIKHIDIKGISSGIYTLRLIFEDKTISKKITIQ